MSLKNKLILIASFAGIAAVAFGCPLLTFAQTQQPTLGVALTAGTLTITHIPGSFNMTPINIDSPSGTFFSYFTNPETVFGSISVQDGRFSGGFSLQVDVNTDYTSGSNTILKSLLGVRTQESVAQENLLGDTPVTIFPVESPDDYTPFSTPVLLINADVSCGDMGRVGTYTVYPSFRLEIPPSTAAGTYTTNITYTLIDIPSEAC
jgi:hypothetical protein